jgi:hypothetical protein
MIQVSFDKFADFRDELAARLAKVREQTVRVWIRRRELVPFTTLEVTYSAVVHVEPESEPASDLLRCVVKIGPYEARSLDASECERLANYTRELQSKQLLDMGLEVRSGEYHEIAPAPPPLSIEV